MSATNHSERALKIMFHRIDIYMLRKNTCTVANVEELLITKVCLHRGVDYSSIQMLSLVLHVTKSCTTLQL